MTVLLELTERPLADEEVKQIEDLDTVLEGAACSCSGSDDQPYQ